MKLTLCRRRRPTSSVRRWSSRSTRRDLPGTRIPPRMTRRTRRTSVGEMGGVVFNWGLLWAGERGFLEGPGGGEGGYKQDTITVDRFFSVVPSKYAFLCINCNCKYASGFVWRKCHGVNFFLCLFCYLNKGFQLLQYQPPHLTPPPPTTWLSFQLGHLALRLYQWGEVFWNVTSVPLF